MRTDERIALVNLDIPPELRLQQVVNIFPDRKRIGIVFDPAQNSEMISSYRIIGDSLGVTIKGLPASTMRDIQNIDYKDLDLVLLIPDTFVCQTLSVKNIILSSFKYRIPVVGIAGLYAQAGAVLAIEPDYYDNGRQAAQAVTRIVKGEDPRDIPVYFCEKSVYFLNRAMAKQLSISLSDKVLKEAADIFGD